jgi:hypothetical protein
MRTAVAALRCLGKVRRAALRRVLMHYVASRGCTRVNVCYIMLIVQLRYIALHRVAPHHIALCCAALCCRVLLCGVASRRASLYRARVLRCSTLCSCVALRRIALRCLCACASLFGIAPRCAVVACLAASAYLFLQATQQTPVSKTRIS